MNILKSISIAFLAMLICGCSSKKDEDFSQIRNPVVPIIVTTNAPEGSRIFVGTGSGVTIGPGYIVTAAHLLKTDDGYLLFKFDKSEIKAEPLKILKVDHNLDLVLVGGDIACPCVTFSKNPPKQDSKAITVGYPLFKLYTTQFLSQGTFQGTFQGKTHEYSISTAFAAPGSSGGALFTVENDKFKWVGIISGIALDNNDISYPTITLGTTNTSIKDFLKDTPAEKFAQ